MSSVSAAQLPGTQQLRGRAGRGPGASSLSCSASTTTATRAAVSPASTHSTRHSMAMVALAIDFSNTLIALLNSHELINNRLHCRQAVIPKLTTYNNNVNNVVSYKQVIFIFFPGAGPCMWCIVVFYVAVKTIIKIGE